MALEAHIEQTAGWIARLELAIERRDRRSVLVRRAHVGPLRVQRAFYPEGDGVCHAVVVHPPGGVVGGDDLATDVTVGPRAHALVTTPAAQKLYRSAGERAQIVTRLRVGAGATLEHLPLETIAFAGCRVGTALHASIAADARFLGWEVVALGRPACGERFTCGRLEQRIAIARAGRPVLLERADHVGGGERLAARWGLGGRAVVGTLIAAGARVDLAAVRDALAGAAGGDAATAATMIEDDVIVARYLGDDARAALAGFEAARAVLRPALCGRPAVAPRIWAT